MSYYGSYFDSKSASMKDHSSIDIAVSQYEPHTFNHVIEKSNTLSSVDIGNAFSNRLHQFYLATSRGVTAAAAAATALAAKLASSGTSNAEADTMVFDYVETTQHSTEGGLSSERQQ